jgi:hypothetical protein
MTKADRLTNRSEALEIIVNRLAKRHYGRYLAFKDALIRAQRHEMSTWAQGIVAADAENPNLGAY